MTSLAMDGRLGTEDGHKSCRGPCLLYGQLLSGRSQQLGWAPSEAAVVYVHQHSLMDHSREPGMPELGSLYAVDSQLASHRDILAI